MGARTKPHLWKLEPEDGRIGRRRGLTELACRSTCTVESEDMSDLAEGVMVAVRPFLMSRGIEVELWRSADSNDQPTGPIMATVFAGLRPVATLTLTQADV